ncbi:hypothetical protein KOW79_000289 [Hemibagrus wyckioides]|uniref:Cytochrome b561 domain-containing protein n=1 Tax=Hemibagrus wyckioides TaxID=337641 RepID=A0A9D3P7R1_9TELE|nr:hypothetical protein KOW79_000289 [Hemibagrus wyckioides]
MDGVIRCSFRSRNPINTPRISGMNSSYYLLFAYGSSIDGEILYHGQNRFVSTAPVDIINPQTVRNMQLPVIIKAHGCLMLITWMFTASTGMMIARYLKAVMGKGCCHKDFWFVAHVSLMSISVATTITAFVLVFAHVGGWSGVDDEEHGLELISAETTLLILFLLGNLMFLVTLLAGISMI